MFKRIFAAIFAIVVVQALYADDYSTLWKAVDDNLEKDMPRKAMSTLNQIISRSQREQNYGEYLAARMKYARVEAEVTPDSIIPAIKALARQAADARDAAESLNANDDEKVLSAVYHAILARLYDIYCNTAADTLVQQTLIPDTVSFTGVKSMLYDIALSNPDLLASYPYSAYNRIVDKGSDDALFNNDLLNVIGTEASRYGVLRDYYLSKGNVRASAVMEYARISRTGYSDDKAISIRKRELVNDMKTYMSVPEGALFVNEYYTMLSDDEDVTDASRYLFLTQNIKYYKDICTKAGKEEYFNHLKCQYDNLVNPTFHADVNDETVILSVRNLSTVDVEVALLDGIDGTNQLSTSKQKELEKLKKIAQKDKNPFRKTCAYDNPIYETHKDTLQLPELAPGVYLVTVKSGNNSKSSLFYHSNLTLLTLAVSDVIPENDDERGQSPTRLAVVYTKTGQPVPDARIHLVKKVSGKVLKETTLTTDDKGTAVFAGDFRVTHARVFTERNHATPDNAFRSTYCFGGMSVYSNKNERDKLSLFIDRAIYRPGQMVKGAVVVHNAFNEDAIHVKKNKRILLKVYDNDGSNVHQDTIYTDGHGNAGFSFSLPTTGKNGTFRVSCSAEHSNSSSVTFRVEDYKRPTFIVESLDKDRYQEPIVIEEKLDSDKKGSMFVLGMPSSTDSVVTVRFQAKTYSQLPVQNASATYSVTRRNSYYRWGGDNAKRIIVPDSLVKTADDGIVSIRFPLSLPEEAHGYYYFDVHISVTDDAGETHEADTQLCVKKVYVKRDGKTVDDEEHPRRTRNEADFSVSDYAFPANGSVTFTMRRLMPTEHPTKACQGDVYAFYTLFNDKEMIESGTVTFDTLYARKFQYSKEYGEGLTIAYAWFMDGEKHSYVTTIRKPQPDLKLNTSWTSFRDCTQPGAAEKWTLHITSSDKKTPVPSASLIATIYDKSLDAIVGRSPSFSTSVLCNYFSFNTSWFSASQSGTSLNYTASSRYYPTGAPYPASFNDAMFPYLVYFNRYMKTVRIRSHAKNAVADGAVFEQAMAVESSSIVTAYAKGDGEEGVKAGTLGSMMKAQGANDVNAEDTDAGVPKEDLSLMVRSNFNETAYFTPSLSSDENGDINIEFMLPEAMTTWQLKGLVHDDIMRNANISAECVAKKDVIVKPNVPRYLREGDKGQLEANVYNTTSSVLNAEVIMQFVNPETEAVIWEQRKNIVLPANGSEAVAMQMPEINGDTLYIYRVVAKAANGNIDGEQHIIPLLPAVETVITTAAFTQHNIGTYTKALSSLLYADSRNRKLTVNYAPHAVDFLIDAVPSVVEVDRYDALSLATAVYVGNMFRDSASRIKGGNDSIRIDSLITSATKELKELQLKDGAWSWWKGMHGSVYMTTEISKLLARLNYLGFANSETNKMLSNAMPYMLKYLKEEANEIRKYLKKYPKQNVHPSETTTNILYINALLRENPDNYAKGGVTSFKKDDTKDIKFLIGLLEKVPTEFTIYGKAHSASVLSLYGRTKKAKEFIESMKEYSVCTEEAGRYYDTPRAYYSWRNHRIPTEVAAIEALRLVTPEDSLTVEEMQKWLLHEKRTQQWDNSANTADAVYAFVLDNSEIEYVKGSGSIKATHAMDDYADNRVMLDGKQIAMTGTKVQTATMPLDGERVFSAEKNTNGTSWGALFIEQQAPLRSVKTTGSGFSITRNIVESDPKVGDKVTVRITIVADRDYDFVEVTDHRAACLEPVQQLSGYRYAVTGGTARGAYSGYYLETRDNKTNYYFDRLSKGTHIIETEYYVDRHGIYQQGICTVKCSYAPEFSAILSPDTMVIK